MGENEQGPDQQSTDQPLSSVDFSALYKEQHPNAVDNDNGKAHFEAAAGDRKETEAAGYRTDAITEALAAQTPGAPVGESIEKLKVANNSLKNAREAVQIAGMDEDSAGQHFDSAQAIIDQSKSRS